MENQRRNLLRSFKN